MAKHVIIFTLQDVIRANALGYGMEQMLVDQFALTHDIDLLGKTDPRLRIEHRGDGSAIRATVYDSGFFCTLCGSEYPDGGHLTLFDLWGTAMEFTYCNVCKFVIQRNFSKDKPTRELVDASEAATDYLQSTGQKYDLVSVMAGLRNYLG